MCGVAHRFEVFCVGEYLGSAGSQNLLRPTIHVFHHLHIVLSNAGVKANFRNPVGIDSNRIEFEVIVVVGNTFTVSTKRYYAAIFFPNLLLQRCTPSAQASRARNTAPETGAQKQIVPTME